MKIACIFLLNAHQVTLPKTPVTQDTALLLEPRNIKSRFSYEAAVAFKNRAIIII